MLRRAACALGLASGLLCSPAHAQSESGDARATAVALFDEAMALMKSGQFKSACPKLAEAQRYSPGVGILYNLSNCYQHIGRTATAWSGFRKAAALAAAAGQTERAKDAQARAAALAPKLSRIKVVVTAGEGVVVTRDGEPLAATLWGSALPVDPGSHVVRAEAPGMQPWRATIEIDGEGKSVTVEVPALLPAEAGAPSPSPAGSGPPRDDKPAPIVSPDEAGPSWQAPLGISLLIGGGVGVGVAGVLGLVAKSQADGADCNEQNMCTAAGVATRADAIELGNIATGVMIGGGVLAAVGLTVWLTAPSDDGPADATAAALHIGPQEMRFELQF